MNKLIITVLLMCTFALPVQALTVKFSEAVLQGKVSAVMPLVKETSFLTVEVTEPVLKLAQDKNEIELQLNIKLLMAGLEYRGHTRLTGSLSYNSEKSAFYVTNMKVREVKVEGMPDLFTPQVIQMAEQVVNPVLNQMPIYKLKDDLTQTMIKAVLESIEVRNKELIATLNVI
ncbi:hypothetical protein AKG98_4063 [Moritella sp. JT01]|uniref:DUF1439 domain-containing protein n=1 Tax=Moritella sp. JT01 TaxID=756698 RepID=UPI00079885BB|nr:DUF1439 domain-containing protein [Moritella sp. JT01]KXO12867.1 hypothetical protein AKG98_4063 [Moritella sp. JT01]